MIGYMKNRGFTIVELITIITILAILAAVVTAIYTPFQLRSAASAAQVELQNARSNLEFFNGIERDYPPNLAGIDYAAPNTVAMVLYTNAPQVRQYVGMNPEQNAQLFLNSCNANMPVVDGGNIYSTSCSFAGNNIHVKGKKSANVVFQGPSVDILEVTLDCGSVCNAAVATMISDFESQGGTWPLDVPKNQVAMPESTLVSYGKATKYCIEARHAQYTDVVYYMQSGDTSVQEGACPSDPELHYP